jgi:MFS family permease
MDKQRKGSSETDRASWRLNATLAFSMLLASLGTSIANIALPTFAVAFSAPFAQVQAVVVVYLAALTISTIVVGRLGDHYGLKRMYLVGLGLFSAASLLCGLAPNLWLLIAARAIQGVGAAFLMTLAMALMRETASKERLGRAMGLLGTVSAVGTALGPSLGGALLPITGWRGIFLIQVPIAVLTLVLAFTSMSHRAGRRNEAPVSVRAMLDGRLAPNLIVNLLVAAVMMTTLVIGPFYLGLGIGLKEALVGLVMSMGPAIAIVSGVPAGRAVDAWGAQRVLGIGLAMLAAGAFLLAVLPNMVGVGGYVLAVAVLTPGYQLFQAANNTAALADIPEDRRGLASGLLNLSRNVGLIVGASVMGGVFAFGVGTADLSQASALAIAGGMRLTFMLAAGMMVLAITVAFWPSLGRAAENRPG